jgi:aldose 1-epimerase
MTTHPIDPKRLEVTRLRSNMDGRDVEIGVQADLGANLVSLKVDGQEFLHYDENALLSTPPKFSGCFIMFPTPCRLPDGRYEFGERTITQTKRGQLYDIHGLVRDEPFKTQLNDDAIDCRLEITPDHPVYEGYPFTGELSVTMRPAAGGLEYSFTFENRSDEPAPAGFGLHPFWRIPGKRRDVVVTIPCRDTMVLEDLVPSGATRPVLGTELELRGGRSLEGLEIDDVFVGRPENAPATIEYRDLGKRLTLDADEVFSHQIVCAPADEPFVCVENLTCAPNAVNLPNAPHEISGLRIVEPGETLGGTTRFIISDL